MPSNTNDVAFTIHRAVPKLPLAPLLPALLALAAAAFSIMFGIFVCACDNGLFGIC